MTTGEARRLLVTYNVPITVGAMAVIELATKAERERCAKVCEDSVVDHGGILECTMTPHQLAKKIREG